MREDHLHVLLYAGKPPGLDTHQEIAHLRATQDFSELTFEHQHAVQ